MLESESERTVLCPFECIVDSREQSPFCFQGLKADAADGGATLVVPTSVKYLESGDYSIRGFESLVAVERKSLQDLYNTLGQGRERFERELSRLDFMAFAAVVVEAGWQQIVYTPPEFSKLSPKSVFRSILAYQQRFRGVHWVLAPDRRFAEIATFRILQRFWIDREREKKQATVPVAAATF